MENNFFFIPLIFTCVCVIHFKLPPSSKLAFLVVKPITKRSNFLLTSFNENQNGARGDFALH